MPQARIEVWNQYQEQQVILQFTHPGGKSWVGLNAEQAVAVAQLLMDKANKLAQIVPAHPNKEEEPT